MTSLALAKIIGAYCIIIGIAMLTRRKVHIAVFHEIFTNRALIYLIGAAEMIVGLIIVFGNIPLGTGAVVITIFGWLAIIEGATYLFISQQTLKKILKMLESKSGYYGTVALYFALGIYLLSVAL